MLPNVKIRFRCISGGVILFTVNFIEKYYNLFQNFTLIPAETSQTKFATYPTTFPVLILGVSRVKILKMVLL